MRQMTVRDIPEDVEAIVRSEADVRGVNLNKAFLTVLCVGRQPESGLLYLLRYCLRPINASGRLT